MIKYAETNILVNESDIFVLSEDKINELKSLASAHSSKRARICLHSSLDCLVHEMIIVVHKSSTIPVHKPPVNKPESYHVLSGKLRVRIFSSKREITNTILLSADEDPRMYRIRGGIWHQPSAVSEWVVYHEVATGPFCKKTDVIFWE